MAAAVSLLTRQIVRIELYGIILKYYVAHQSLKATEYVFGAKMPLSRAPHAGTRPARALAVPGATAVVSLGASFKIILRIGCSLLCPLLYGRLV